MSKSDRLRSDPGSDLRAAARVELQALLESDDERVRLMAAKAIGSYSPERPPASDADAAARKADSTAPIVTWGDLVQTALDIGALRGREDGSVEIAGQVLRAHTPPPVRETAPPASSGIPYALAPNDSNAG